MGRIKGRPSKYLKSLKNNKYWSEVRELIRIRDNWSCRVCGSKINLETHHIKYYVSGVCILGKEKKYLKYLVLLCSSCHKITHENKDHKWNPSNKNGEVA